jgi:pimeloyl-ACP methyl ester carboxylesterase
VNAHVPGPYILVGHLFSGFNVRLYASQYPEEVAGMVLVNPMPPDYRSETLAVLPPESPDESPSLNFIRIALTEFETLEAPESFDFTASEEQVRAANGLGDLPLVVLTDIPPWYAPDLPSEAAEKIKGVWQDLHMDLLNLSSNSSHVIVTGDKPGYTQVKESQLVIDAILNVLNETKK